MSHQVSPRCWKIFSSNFQSFGNRGWNFCYEPDAYAQRPTRNEATNSQEFTSSIDGSSHRNEMMKMKTSVCIQIKSFCIPCNLAFCCHKNFFLIFFSFCCFLRSIKIPFNKFRILNFFIKFEFLFSTECETLFKRSRRMKRIVKSLKGCR